MKTLIAGRYYIQLMRNIPYGKKDFTDSMDFIVRAKGILLKKELTGFLWWKRMIIVYLIPENFYKK